MHYYPSQLTFTLIIGSSSSTLETFLTLLIVVRFVGGLVYVLMLAESEEHVEESRECGGGGVCTIDTHAHTP